jgi:hypothetical protein
MSSVWVTLLTENLKERYLVEAYPDDSLDLVFSRIEAMHPKDPSTQQIFRRNPDQIEYELRVADEARTIPWSATGTDLAALGLKSGAVITLARRTEAPCPAERPTLLRVRSLPPEEP